MDAEDFLAHHGVMGMKWGKRKAARKERDRETLEARARQEKRNQDFLIRKQNAAVKSYAATSRKGREAAEKAYARVKNTAIDHPDELLANRLTRGEKAVNAVVLGALGVVTVASIASSLRR